MKNIKYIIGTLLLLFLIATSSCSELDYGDAEAAKSNGKEINDFYIAELGLKGTKIAPDTIVLKTLRSYDLQKFKKLKPSFKVSVGSSVYPDSTLVQDFTDTVRYVVTSERGEQKTWYIFHRYMELTASGIGGVRTEPLWFKTQDELGLAANLENTIASIGDKIVVSRTGSMFDAMTGEAAGKLNFDGIVGNPTNATTNIPFVLENDDAGNLVGSTLGAWSNPFFRAYRWNTPEAAPIKIMDYKSETTPVSHYGRKLTAKGDVTKDGILGSFDVGSQGTTGNHDFWNIKAGQQIGEPQRVVLGVAASFYPKASPLAYNSVYPYYFIKTFAGAVNKLSYVWKDAEGEVKNISISADIIEEDQAGIKTNYGWGSLVDLKVFNFYNKDYVAVMHYTLNNYYFTILDPGANPTDSRSYTVVSRGKYFETQGVGINVNRSAGMAILQKKGEVGVVRMYLYGLMTSTGIVCYEFDNYQQ